MGRIDDKLNNIFSDDDADDILGPVKTKTPARRTTNTQIEKNFAEVVAFFEAHGRLPHVDSDDSTEAGLWAKYDGIRIRDDFRVLVAHLDTHGLLEMKADEDVSNDVDEDIHDIDLDEINASNPPTYIVSSESVFLEAQESYDANLRTIDNEYSELVKTIQKDAVKPLRKALSTISHEMSVEVLNLELVEDTCVGVVDRLNTTADSLIETAAKLQSLAEKMGAAVDHIEKEAAGHHVAAQIAKEAVPKPVLVTPSYPNKPERKAGNADDTRSIKTSLDEILNDDEFDELLDCDDCASDSILGGQRAIKAHERDNADQTNREPCPSFELYRDRFTQYKADLESGKLEVSSNRSELLSPGDLFLWDGLIALLTGESIKGDVREHSGKRLHVVFSNGTEAWLREGSITRSMYAYGDRGNKVICKRLVYVEEQLFSADGTTNVDENTATGFIYVVRTLSKDPGLSKIRKNAVKIGVTKNPVSVRLSNAEKDPTFLCAPVDVINTFTLYNLDARKVEETLHAFFGEVRLKIGAKDRFGNDVSANEWFLVGAEVVSEAINLLIKNELSRYVFNKQSGKVEIKQH